MNTALLAGVVIYLLGALADLYTTKRALFDQPTGLREKNPVGAWVMSRWGIAGAAVLKGALLAGGWWAAVRFDADVEAGVGFIVAGTLQLLVAWNNRRLILGTRR